MMESGLSLRMQKTLDELLPVFTTATPQKHHNLTTCIDLANAQNEVLRSELVELFKSTVEDKVTSQVCIHQVA